jgi:hypothetical protein
MNMFDGSILSKGNGLDGDRTREYSIIIPFQINCKYYFVLDTNKTLGFLSLEM